MKRSRFLLLLLLLLLLVAVPLVAETTASITGIATHEGSPLAGVEVRASSPAMQGTRTTATDINGRYAFIAVPPGEYLISFALGGMTPASTSVRAGIGQMARADAELLDAGSEAAGAAEALPSAVETLSVQTNLRGAIVDILPTGRDLPSVVGLTATGDSIAGVPLRGSAWLLDGGIGSDPALRGGGGVDDFYVEDAIQETAVLSAAIPAEYGRFAGGVVNAITKSGGNDWSGSFRDTVSNPSWTEPSPYQSIENADETDQTFEATLGGSILFDRLWFFAAGRQARDTNQFFFTRSPSYGYTTTIEDRRWQAKLTGQAGDRHNLMATFFDKPLTREDYCSIGNCIEASSLDPHVGVPRQAITGRYDGVFTQRFVGEAYWSRRDGTFDGFGGDSTDPARGTWGWDANSGGLYGAPLFCAVCGPNDEREGESYGAKATWYRPTSTLGTHTISGGYDSLRADMVGNNYQSGSGFEIDTYSKQQYLLGPGDVFRPTIAPGDEIWWYPVPEPDRPSDQRMHGLYVNDRWDWGTRWSVNVGLRYDRNDIVDESGYQVSDAGSLSPRLAAVWDARGDGRYRVNASYGRYVDMINAVQGSSTWLGGKPLLLIWQYGGPVIQGLSTPEAFAQLFAWFNAQCDDEGNCGTANLDALYYAEGGASSNRWASSIESPSSDEASIGFSFASGGSAFIRFDAFKREWSNFLTRRITQETGRTTDYFGNPSDLAILENNDDGLRARYDTLMVQGAYRFGTRWVLGGNYAWSERSANTGSGGAGFATGTHYYPELTGFPNHNPVRDSRKQTLRAWLLYDLPTRFGTFDFSVLENIDTGKPYGEQILISTRFDMASRKLYASPPPEVGYALDGGRVLYFDDVTSTDIGIRYQTPLVRAAGVFVDVAVTNLFNEDAQTGGDTRIHTWMNPQARCPQSSLPGQRCAIFNPYTQTPVEGIHYVRSRTYGQAMSVNHYQTPRTVSFSTGIRF